MDPSADLGLTRLLRRWRCGEPDALDQLLTALCEPLVRIAHACLGGERADHTLDRSALVHEAWLLQTGLPSATPRPDPRRAPDPGER